jgi:hypothetical protein
VEIRGAHKVSYQGKGDQEIKLHEGESFQIVSTGPTPESDCTTDSQPDHQRVRKEGPDHQLSTLRRSPTTRIVAQF